MSDDGVWIPDKTDPSRKLPSGRFSIHTTGEVHRYANGERKSTIYIEPLHSLTKMAQIGFVCIPRTERLDKFDETKDRHDTAGVLEIPDHVSERITFVVEVGPIPQEPATYGIALHYELYSVVVRVVPSACPPELSEHFIHGMPKVGQFEKRQIDKVRAELGFYQRIHGRSAFIFREDRGGAYVAMAIEPMLRTPNVIITFDSTDLYVEVIPFEKDSKPTHKVRFWICDKGGRNKKDDLRPHITSVMLEAEL